MIAAMATRQEHVTGHGASQDNVSTPAKRGPGMPRLLRWGGTTVIGAWATFWSWFAASVAIGEGGQSWLYAGGLIVIALGLVAAVARWPRAAGIAAAALGAASIPVLTHPGMWMLMGLPLVVGGVLAAWGGGTPRR